MQIDGPAFRAPLRGLRANHVNIVDGRQSREANDTLEGKKANESVYHGSNFARQ
jgi:hypothetical protein